VIVEDDRVYLPYLHRDEAGSAAQVRLLLNGQSLVEAREIDVEARLSWAQQEAGITLNIEQEAAVRTALTSKVSVLTGGAGTGKTSSLRVLIHILQAERIEFALMAPTGKAANRMSEATDCAAMTIHRGLAFNPSSFSFEVNEDDPLDAAVVIVDETSMIDVSLFHALVRAVKHDAHLVLVGDQNQLPSVGPGSVISDLIASGIVPATHLVKIYRQDKHSGIVPNARDINEGRMPRLVNGDTNDFFFAVQAEAEGVTDEIVSLVSRRIPAKFEIPTSRSCRQVTNARAASMRSTQRSKMRSIRTARRCGIPGFGSGIRPSNSRTIMSVKSGMATRA
jgi:exodeoxyribonuclease V alpha subunit